MQTEYLLSNGTWRSAVVRKTELNLCSFVLGGILGLKQKANLKAACLQLVCYTDTLTQFCYGWNVELGKNNNTEA